MGAERAVEIRSASVSIDIKTPFADLPDYQQNCIIYGDEGWRGIKGFFKWLETKKYKLHVRVFLAKYRGYTMCPDCKGGRLRQEARDVKIGGAFAARNRRDVDRRRTRIFRRTRTQRRARKDRRKGTA